MNTTMPIEIKNQPQKKKLFWPFIYALITGTILNTWFDQIPLAETKIPAYGYYSTVAFTHECASDYAAYIGLVICKGLIFLGIFYLFIKWF